MLIINKGERATLLLKAGEVVSLSAGGMISEFEKNSAVTSFDYAYKHGPFSTDKQLLISAISSTIEYTISNSEFNGVGYVDCLVAALPEVGKSGVIYFTEVGLKYWSDVTGEYLAADAAPSLPVVSEESGPEITCDGDGVEDDLLTCSTGTWTARPTSYVYQWYRGASPIVGQTANTHVIVTADLGEDITCEVAARNGIGLCESVATSDTYSVPSGE
jgi:hypothetical protein